MLNPIKHFREKALFKCDKPNNIYHKFLHKMSKNLIF